MFKQISTLLIWSENYKPLADWYQKILELKNIEEINHPQDTGVLFEFPGGKPWIWIGQHDKVKGKNRDNHRQMFNIEVDSVGRAYTNLLDKGVRFFAKPFKAPTFDKYFATFFDLDDNLIQIIGGK